MTLRRTVFLTSGVWVVVVTVLHLWLNLNVLSWYSGDEDRDDNKFRIGFLPVT